LVRLVRTNVIVMLVGALVMGCAAAAPSVEPTGASPAASAVPLATASPEATPAPAASPAASLIATASPGSPSSDPVGTTRRLISAGECGGLSATIDLAGRYHVASVCDGAIRYVSSMDGATWSEASFPPPVDRLEFYPQIAVDGDTVYLAYTRIAQTDGGCGDPGLQDLGVYVRSRHLPDSTWTEPVRIGSEGDGIQAFRAVGGVLHLTVTAADDGVFYESSAGSALTRVGIPDALSASLRVGDDRHARIAYTTGHAIRYARVDGSELSILTVAATDETYLKAPALVLGPRDRGYLMWTQDVNQGGGCADIEPGPLDGTYVGTDATGQWASQRIAAVVNSGSFTLDPSTGRLHVIIAGPLLTYFTSLGDGRWTSKELPGTERLEAPVIRLDPATGRPVVFGLDWRDTPGIAVLGIR
jgi:hypothetical protein